MTCLPPSLRDVMPYRVEWKSSVLTERWAYIKSFTVREEAVREANESIRRWGGYARVITQHTIVVVPDDTEGVVTMPRCQ